MKRAIVAVLLPVLALLAACGGGSSSSSSGAPQTSGLTNRALVTNATAGVVHIIDASKDAVATQSVAIGTAPTFMAVSPSRDATMVFDSGSRVVATITNSSETETSSIQLPDLTESMAAKDVNTGYAAVRNASVSGQTDTGAVLVLDMKNSKITATIGIPRARRIMLSADANTLLVLSDNWQCKGDGTDCVALLDISSANTTWDCTSAAPTNCTVVSGFNRPSWGVFSSDKVLVMNCGPECGGPGSAGVQSLSLTSKTAGVATPVSAATIGLLSGNTLYVAGTKNAAQGAGLLTVLDVSSGNAVVSKADIPISDGLHTHIALGSNNKLFVGSINCTNDPNSATPTGCLTIFDTSANTAVIDTARDVVPGQAKGFVTGIAPLANRSIVYVTEGGELRVFDTNTSQEIPQKIDIVGQAADVKTIDQ